MVGRFSFEFASPSSSRAGARRPEAEPPRVLVLGDFSGRAARALGARVATWRPRRVEIERFDDVLAPLAPALEVAVGPDRRVVAAGFARLDDFHPDRLAQALPLFGELEALRARTAGTAPAAARPDDAGESADAAVQRLLGRAPHGDLARDAVDRLAAEAARGHIVPASDPALARLGQAIDEELAARMRALLHHPEFQRLEAAWRGLHRLADAAGTCGEAEVHLLDATPAELAADLVQSAGDVRRSALHRALAPAGSGAAGWNCMVVVFEFGVTAEDLFLLAGLGVLGASLRCPVLAAADPRLVGAASAAELAEPRTWTPDAALSSAWAQVRRGAVAPWILLAAPRCLVRLPYGPKSDPIERFAFDELAEDAHDALLWGNPALALAAGRLAGDGQQALEIEDLPAVVVDAGDERRLIPCAEVLLPEAAVDALLAAGLTPLVSDARRATIRVPRLQSIADPPTSLWSGDDSA
ncbi:MAG: type VI secretion system contractile sheath large subunit [Acidobacteria bacterium]|nr:type VI secretion system contractile sheath large subunit [Acidobacteriota bacterium]